ncbi:MAG: hypothetical protein ACK5Z5_08415 [Neisseriaceae bacterium]
MLKPKYILIAIVLYLVAAYYSIGHNSPDEYYQILEFAAYKLGLGDVKFLTWEYHFHIRPALQVWLAVFVYKVLAYFSVTNPFTIAFFLRLLAAFISLVAAFTFIKAFLTSIKNETSKKWFVLLSLFTWLIVYNSVRYSSENISEKFFLLGFSLLFIPRFNRSLISYFFIGLLFGLSFDTRFQNLILIIVVYAWLISINNFKVIGGEDKKVVNLTKLISITGGVLITVSIGILIDKWFYGTWVFAAFNYLNMNLFKGMAASFGIEPWYFYLLVAAFIPYGPFYIISTFISIKYKLKNPAIWLVIAYVVAHSLIGHKEIRFLIPVLCFMPLMIAYSLDLLIDKQIVIKNGFKIFWKILWYINCIFVILCAVIPSGTNVLLCKAIYDKFNQPMQFYAITQGGNLLNFYKRKNVELVYINNINQANCDKNKVCLLALTCQQVKANPQLNGKMIYRNCYDWLFKLNFNDWLDRAAVYNIYQINEESK